MIVSGVATGEPADPNEVAAVAKAVSVPTLIGSGVTAENISTFPDADAFIVGSSIKAGGHWAGAMDPQRTAELVRAFESKQ